MTISTNDIVTCYWN